MLKTLACALALFLSSSSAFAAMPDAWVVVRDHDGVSMHGDTGDLEAAHSHLREVGPGYLWFRHAGKEYLVRGDSLREVDELTRKQAELGAEQGRLGKVQGELGREQGRIGREQGKLSLQQRDLSRQVQRKIDELIESSLKDGSAKPI